MHKAKKFTNNVEDLKKIYMLQVRSKLEQSAAVGHSSLTKQAPPGHGSDGMPPK